MDKRKKENKYGIRDKGYRICGLGYGIWDMGQEGKKEKREEERGKREEG